MKTPPTDYRNWTPVEDPNEQNRLNRTRNDDGSPVYAPLFQLKDGEPFCSYKRAELLTIDELEQVRRGCLMAGQYYARLALLVAEHADKNFGLELDTDPEIISLAADLSSEEPQ